MKVTFDTEDSELVALVWQFLQANIKQRMLSVLSVAEPANAGLFLGCKEVAQLRKVADDEQPIRGCSQTYSQMLTKHLLDKIAVYARSKHEVTAAEQVGYQNSLITWITTTIKTGDPNAIDAIRSLWDNEPWADIQEKMLTEGSTWYVWWMDGVRRYIALDRGWITNDASDGIKETKEANGPHTHE